MILFIVPQTQDEHHITYAIGLVTQRQPFKKLLSIDKLNLFRFVRKMHVKPLGKRGGVLKQAFHATLIFHAKTCKIERSTTIHSWFTTAGPACAGAPIKRIRDEVNTHLRQTRPTKAIIGVIAVAIELIGLATLTMRLSKRNPQQTILLALFRTRFIKRQTARDDFSRRTQYRIHQSPIM